MNQEERLRHELLGKPVLRGDKFCSPACGRGCTKQDHDRANKHCMEVYAQLQTEIGGEWLTRVREDAGWTFEVYTTDSRLIVTPVSDSGGYKAVVRMAVFPDFMSAENADPATAVRVAVAKSVGRAKAILDSVKSLPGYPKEAK